MAARAAWPGWTRQRTLLLPVPPADWAPADAPVTVDGIVLQPKDELHITLVARKLGRALADVDGVREAFEAQDWRWERTGRRTLLRAAPDRKGAPVPHSVIEHLELPAMARFHAALGTLLERPLPVPPPHVTLYVAGAKQGIGLPDPATLARRRVRDLGVDDPPFTGGG